MSSTLQALKPRAMNCFIAAFRMALRVERRGNLFPLAAFLVRSTSKFSGSFNELRCRHVEPILLLLEGPPPERWVSR